MSSAVIIDIGINISIDVRYSLLLEIMVGVISSNAFLDENDLLCTCYTESSD